MFYYFLTIDKAISVDRIKPRVEDYMDIMCDIETVTNCEYTGKYNLECFEHKQKGNVRKGNKVFDWLHYHCIVQCRKKINYGMNTLKGYHLHWVPIRTIAEMAKVTDYICKEKKDKALISEEHKRNTNIRELIQVQKNIKDFYKI